MRPATVGRFHGGKVRSVRTIAIINQKGGCGKTTVSINLAAVLASRGQRTLLVDMDPQAHCALGLAVPESQIDKSIGEMLRAGMDGSRAFSDIIWQISRHLDLAPSTMALAGIEQELSTAPDRDRRLVQILSTVADLYDYCVIDCPPSIGLLTFNALRAAHEVIIPVETGYFSMQGSIKQQATIEMLARRAGHSVRFKVLATMYDVRTKLAREILAELRKQFGDHLLPLVVHFNSKLKEAASFGQPIVEYDATSSGMRDFDALANWLAENPPEHVGLAVPVGAGVGENGGKTSTMVTEPLSTSVGTNPAMSRAAELVGRARALSARTAALAARLSGGSGNAVETDAEATPLRIETAATPRQSLPSVATERPVQPPPRLADKLARMHGVRLTAQGLLFIQPDSDAGYLSVAGDFNNWSPTATPLKRNEDLGVFQACVEVAPGRYRYRLVVDGNWVHDPYNSYVEANPFGELNSVIEVKSE